MGATGGMAMMAGNSMAGAYASSVTQRSQAEFQQAQYEQNQKLADSNAKDAEFRGEKSAQIEAQRTRMNIGAQRAAAAASGVDVNSGSALGLQADTAGQGAMNELTIKNNAWREAWGFKVQAANYGQSAVMAGQAGANASRNTLIAGGMNAVGYGVRGIGYASANNSFGSGSTYNAGGGYGSAGGSSIDYSSTV